MAHIFHPLRHTWPVSPPREVSVHAISRKGRGRIGLLPVEALVEREGAGGWIHCQFPTKGYSSWIHESDDAHFQVEAAEGGLPN